MSGHSKWSTIKRKKGALDIQRSKAFTRIVKEITVAVKQGGTDIASNPRLRLAVQNAKGINMPKDNIEKAINKGNTDSSNYDTVFYEGNGIKGSCYIVECLTDNTTRTVGEVRTLFNRNGGSLGKNGSVLYNFERKSIFNVNKSDIPNKDDFLLEVIDYGGEDLDDDDENDQMYIIGNELNFGNLQAFLENKGIDIIEANLCYLPINTVTLDDEDTEKVINFINVLEDLDDVQRVYHNVSFEKDLN